MKNLYLGDTEDCFPYENDKVTFSFKCSRALSFVKDEVVRIDTVMYKVIDFSPRVIASTSGWSHDVLVCEIMAKDANVA